MELPDAVAGGANGDRRRRLATAAGVGGVAGGAVEHGDDVRAAAGDGGDIDRVGRGVDRDVVWVPAGDLERLKVSAAGAGGWRCRCVRRSPRRCLSSPSRGSRCRRCGCGGRRRLRAGTRRRSLSAASRRIRTAESALQLLVSIIATALAPEVSIQRVGRPDRLRARLVWDVKAGAGCRQPLIVSALQRDASMTETSLSTWLAVYSVWVCASRRTISGSVPVWISGGLSVAHPARWVPLHMFVSITSSASSFW